MLKVFTKKTAVARKDFFMVFILLFNALTWFYMISRMINSVLSNSNMAYAQNLLIWATYSAAIIGSSIIGSILPKERSRLNFLYLWIILGTITSLLPVLLDNFTAIHILIISALLGVSFGLGMPSCLAYFADHTLVENRGRTGGVILLTTNLIAPLFAILIGTFNLTVNSIIFAMWRASGLIVYPIKTKEKIASKMKRNISFISILHDKSFVLYFIAWLMFCLIHRFEEPILSDSLSDFHHFMLIIGPIIGSLFALIAGILSDWVGRKRVVLYGFVTLGIAYAIIGIDPTALVSWYFFLAIGSISTGILWVTFILILWGDLSQSSSREKYYAIGEIPYFLTGVVQLLSAPYVTLISETSAFSLAAFFLFIAVLPLLYAPETLPEKKIELRRLRKYVEKAKKVKEKYTEKSVKG